MCLQVNFFPIVKNNIQKVVSEQLTKLQDAADKCKSMTKAGETQLKFFQQVHPTSRELLEAANANMSADQSIVDILR